MTTSHESWTNRKGVRVELIDNRDGSFEELTPPYPEEMMWASLCLDHGTYVLHRTRALAEAFCSVTEEFCEECSKELGPRSIGRKVYRKFTNEMT